MDIILAILQMLFAFINDNFDQLEHLRARRDLDDPVIIVPDQPKAAETVQTDVELEEPEIVIPDQEVVVPEQEIFIPVTHVEDSDGDTPGFFTLNKETTDETTKLDINLFSEPFCATGFYPLPGWIKDLILTFSMLANLVQLFTIARKAILQRRRQQAQVQNHPINRPILGQLGKLLVKVHLKSVFTDLSTNLLV